MSCCTPSTGASCGCPVQPCPSKHVLWLPRIAFGLVLIAYGVNHYRNLEGFIGMSKSVFPSVPALAMAAGILGYVVPALMILGGLSFATRQMCCLGKMCILASLSGIIGWAALAVLVGDATAGGAMMPMIQNASMLFVLYYVIKKMTCCKQNCAPAGTCSK